MEKCRCNHEINVHIYGVMKGIDWCILCRDYESMEPVYIYDNA